MLIKPYIRDPRLVLFGLLALGASIIAAHGSYSFFLLIVEPWLAAIFVGVVALGVVGLAAAGATGRTLTERATYYAGMVLFLALETLANYFWGQGTFVWNVVQKAAPGSDLATLAQDPLLGRVLVALYLALASLAVAAFTHKAASRLAEIRAGLATEAAERATWEGIAADLRERLERLTMQLATRTQQARDQDQTIAELREAVRAEVKLSDRNDRKAARRRELIHALVAKLREERLLNAAWSRGAATRNEELATLRAVHEADRQELDQLRAELVTARTAFAARPAPIPPTRAAVAAYALEQQQLGRSRSDVAAELGFSESSIREWEKVIAQRHASAAD